LKIKINFRNLKKNNFRISEILGISDILGISEILGIPEFL
jgi:hypothetical protein